MPFKTVEQLEEEKNRNTTSIFRIPALNGEKIPQELYCKIIKISKDSDEITIEFWNNLTTKRERSMKVNHAFFDELERIKNIVYMNQNDFDKFYEAQIVYAIPPAVSRLGDID